MYHGTTLDRAQSILKKGIQPSDWSKEHGLPLPEDSRLKSVGPFVGDEDVAQKYASGAERSGPKKIGAVIKATVDPRKLTEDKAMVDQQLEQDLGGAWEHYGVIEPERLIPQPKKMKANYPGEINPHPRRYYPEQDISDEELGNTLGLRKKIPPTQ